MHASGFIRVGSISFLLSATHVLAQSAPPPAGSDTTDGSPPESSASVDEDTGFRNAYPSLAVLPRYPKRALRKQIDGQATIGFEVNRFGRAENIKVISESPAGSGFAEEASEVLELWAFSPARLPLCGTTRQYAEQTFRFDHDGEQKVDLVAMVVEGTPQPERPLEEKTLKEYWEAQKMGTLEDWESRNFVVIRRVEPEYPDEALDRRKEGIVSLVFLIGRDGSVSNVEVVDSVKGTYFQKPALAAIRQWRFEPRRRNGMPVDSVACHEFVFH
ncbi:MAG: energy transducer TonB, partial [Gammaproteobacteria bacterium]